MIPGIYINPAMGSIFIIVLIFIDYIRKYNTDTFQRKIFLIILLATFFAVASDFVNHIMEERTDKLQVLQYVIVTIFLNSQNITYYAILVFIDYFVHSDTARTKKVIAAVTVFLLIFFISTVLNLPLKFYFSIGAGNHYTKGPLYLLRLAISYLPILIMTVYVIVEIKNFKRSQVYLLILFALLTGFGAALDIILKTGSLTWSCFTAALLYLYFFIIQTDAKIDSLTGIGNRAYFNEFINNLARHNARRGGTQSSGKSWAIAMIDLDHFKKINDTLGHLEGDNALRDMAAIIKSTIRHCDFAARYGGDEFIIGVRAESGIENVLDRIKEAMEMQNEKNLRPYKIEMSYGCDVFTADSGRSTRDFLAHIDKLMYKNKAERRRAGDCIMAAAAIPGQEA
jgi:diguanylate cyclase (GGDEF)-like protein